MSEKSPVIIMIVGLSGVTVGIDNTEDLKPEQRPGFEVLMAKVQNFAADLIDNAVENLNARPKTVN